MSSKKKLESRGTRDEHRRQNRIRIGVSLFMLFILVFSSVAYFFTPDTNSFRYGGVRFKGEVDGNGNIRGYTATINGKDREFFSRPTDSLDIALPPGFPESLKDAPIVIVLFDPKDNLTAVYDAFRYELERVLDGKQVIPTVTRNDTVYPFTVYSCDLATPDAPVIYLTQGERSITATGACITISGNQFDYASILDRLRYRIFGVTEK